MTAAPAVLTTGRYTLVPSRCAVRFTARTLGLPVPGELSVRSGEVIVDDTGAAVTAVLDAASFRTASNRRDRDVRAARFLDTERHPEIHFTGRWDGAGSLTGHLAVKGTTAPVELAVQAVEAVEPAMAGHPAGTVRARARVDRRPFPAGPSGPVLIGRWIDVELDIAVLAS